LGRSLAENHRHAKQKFTCSRKMFPAQNWKVKLHVQISPRLPNLMAGATGGSTNQIPSTKNGEPLPNLVKCYLHIAANLSLPELTKYEDCNFSCHQD
jgi:hypothetical protein